MNPKGIAALALSALVAFTPLQARSQAGPMADGEILRIDKLAGKLTLKHGPIPSIDMPPMTMEYRVKDPAMLKTMKAGDRVKFSAEIKGGEYVVTAIERRR